MTVRRHTLLFDERDVFHLSYPLRLADRATDRLGAACETYVPVRAVLALVTDEICVAGCPDAVSVMAHTEVVPWLRRRPQRLGRDMIMRLATQAEKPRTWMSGNVRAA